MSLPDNVDDVVAGVRHEAGNALGPQGGRDARGEPAPVETGDDRRLDPQSVEQPDEVPAEGRLLPLRIVAPERNLVVPKPRKYGTITCAPRDASLGATSS